MAEWPWSEPKTAPARKALEALDLDGRILIVLDRDDHEVAYKSFRNLPLAQVIHTGELNAYDVLCNDWIVFTRSNLPGTTVDVTAEGSDAVETDEGTDVVEAAPAAAAEPADTATADTSDTDTSDTDTSDTDSSDTEELP
jgi:Ribosomal protein L4/L1 family